MSYKYVLRDEEFKMRTPRLPSLTDVHAFYVLAYVYLAPAIADEVIIIIICKFIERHIMCLQKATEVYVFVASVFCRNICCHSSITIKRFSCRRETIAA